MKPAFALSLSFEGISLLHRAAGGWRLVGDVDINKADFLQDLSKLRDKALLLSPQGVSCKLILPNDQIRYLTVNTGSFEGETRDGIIQSAVAEATPYQLADLAFDTSPESHLTHIAIVARETLSEAEEFAAGNGFDPVSFVAIPGENDFLGEPFFGSTRAYSESTGADAVEPDGIAVVVIGPAEFPEVEDVSEPDPDAPVAEDSTAPDGSPPTGEGAAEADSAPTVGFASRRANKKPSTEQSTTQERAVELDESSKHESPTFSTSRVAPLAPSKTQARIPPAPKEAEPTTAEPPAVAIAETEPVAAFAAPRLPGQDSESEKQRMTIFGARDAAIGGKPRFLGLLLTVALVLVLAAVATWASWTSGFGLFDPETDSAPSASSPPQVPLDPVQPLAPGDAPQAVPAEDAPQSPGTVLDNAIIGEKLANLPPSDSDIGLTGTDSAVLDALRVEPETVETITPEEPTESTDASDALSRISPETRYAVTGIWDSAPVEPTTPSIIDLDDLYVASIDRTDLSQDAVALPSPISFDTDLGVSLTSSPVAPGSNFALNDRGLVEPTVEGTLNPGGVVVYLGRPARVPPAVPVRFESAPETDEALERLAGQRPRLRPSNLVEQAERSQLGGRSREELAGVRPKLRPFTEKEEAEEDQTPTALAVVQAKRPKLRPQNIAASATRRTTNLGSAANIDRNGSRSEQVGSIAPRTVKPKAPSPASVARQATMNNAINLRRVNLIGVYGTPSNRRALVRLPSGRYKKVKVGDRVDGGRVVAIGDSELRYQKGGRNMTLKIPSG